MADQLTQTLRRGFRGTVSTYFATAVAVLISFLISVVLVRYLTQDEYGVYRLISSFLIIGGYLTSLGLDQAVLRFGAELNAFGRYRGLVRLVGSTTAIRGVAIAVICVCLVALDDQVLGYLEVPAHSSVLLPLALAIFTLTSLNNLWGKTFLLAREDFVQESGNTILRDVTQGLGYFLVLRAGYGLVAVLWIWLLSRLTEVVYYFICHVYWRIKVRVRSIVESSTIRISELRGDVTRYAGYTFLAQGAHVFREFAADILILGFFLSSSEVALYALATSLIVLATKANPLSILRGVLQSIIVSRYEKERKEAELEWVFEFLFKLGVFVTAPGLLILMLLGEDVIRYIYSPEYVEALTSLWILAPGFLLVALTYVFTPILAATDQPQVFAGAGVFAFYNLFADIVLIPPLGYNGAAIATSSAGIFAFFYYWWMTRRKTGLKLQVPWAFIGTLTVNLALVTVFIVASKWLIDGVYSLLLTLAFATVLYFGVNWKNRVFTSDERDMINRAVGAKVWVF